MGVFFVSESGLRNFLERLSQEVEVYGTVEREERLHYEGLNSDNAKLVTLNTVRNYASPKSLLFPVCEKVAAYSTTGPAQPLPEQPFRAVVGLRQCDLAAIHMLDLVFLEGDFIDPFYKARRDATLLLSTDCRDAAETCFCTMIEGKPYPTQGFDLNFSPLKDGCVVETGSEKGAALVEKFSQFFGKTTETQLKEREQNRAAITKQVQDQNKPFEPDRPIREVFKGEIDQEKLQRLAWDCVECGACTNICPSCHCFLMFDRPVEYKEKTEGPSGEYERLREWDSCVFGEYARMAGVGGMKPNPRPNFRTRFANRFLHKYLYFYDLFKQFQCSGCGRCADACLGAIDPRRIIKEMSKKNHG